MSSASHNHSYSNANGNSNINFQCVAGAFCKIPSVDFSTSPHKCPYCQRLLHGICGILHDPDSVTYYNRCNFCDTKFSNSQNQLPPHQAVIPSPIPAPQNCEFQPIQVATSSIRTTTPTSQLSFSGTPITNSQLLTRTPTPTSDVLNSALNRGLTIFQRNSDSQLDDINDDLLSETDIVDSIIPSWFHLDISEIYDHLNPATKKGQNDQRTWRKCAIDVNGKPITSVGVLANRLLKILTGKKFLPDTPLNSKL